MVESAEVGTDRAPASRATASTSSHDAERKGRPSSCSGPGSRPTSRCSASPTAPSRWVSRSRSARPWSPGVIGIVFSFLLCGFIALAGKRGSAPTMVLSPRGVRRARQQAAHRDLVAAHRRLGDRAGHPGHARDGHGLRPARARRRHPDEGHRPAGGRRARRRRGRARLRRDHAPADRHHDRHRGAHGRLRLPRGRSDQLGHGLRAARGLGRAGDRRAGVPHDRLRARLGQRRRRLLALPAARRVLAGGRRLDHGRARPSRRSCCWCSGCCSPGRRRTCPPRSPPTRSARSPTCCPPGSSCRSCWWRCWAWSAARCWTSTRPGSRCCRSGCASRGGRRRSSTAC